MFDDGAETVHHTQHADHCGCDDRNSNRTNTGYDINGIVSFFREKVSKSDMGF